MFEPRRRRWSFGSGTQGGNGPVLPSSSQQQRRHQLPQMTASRSYQGLPFSPPLASTRSNSSSSGPISATNVDVTSQEIGAWWTSSSHPTTTNMASPAAPVSATNVATPTRPSVPPPPPPRPPPLPARKAQAQVGVIDPAAAAVDSTPRLSSSASTTFDPARAHLHYRDPEYLQYQQQHVLPHPQQPQRPAALAAGAAYQDVSRIDEKNDAERNAMHLALQASLSAREQEQRKATQEDADLRKALAESAALARAELSPASVQEQLDLSRALLESQRQALKEQHWAGAGPSKPGRSQQLGTSHSPATTTSGTPESRPFPGPGSQFPRPEDLPSEQDEHSPPHYAGPLSLHESEWLLHARNEKGGSLWREGGAHGWLPPGAGTARDEDVMEQEMLALAIRISLEEEAQAKKWRGQFPSSEGASTPSSPYPHGPAWAEPSFSNDRTSLSWQAESESTPRETRSSSDPPKPTRPPPVPPIAPQASVEIVSQEKGKQVDRLSDFDGVRRAAEPASTSTFSVPDPMAPQRAGSPYEMPFLVPTSPQEPNYFPLVPKTAPASSTLSRGGSSGSQPSQSTDSLHGRRPGSTPSHSSGASLRTASDDESSERAIAPDDPLEVLTIRNPDPPSSDQAQSSTFIESPLTTPLGDSTLEDPIESQYAGRALSLVSERSEPGESSLDSTRRMRGSPQSASPVYLIDQRRSSEATLSASPSRIVPSPKQASPTPLRAASPPPTSSVLATLAGLSFGAIAVPAAPGIGDSSPPIVTAAASDGAASFVSEPRLTFRDGVSFGWLDSSTHTDDADCDAPFRRKMDGAFPSKIELSSFEEDRATFAIEASTWSTLLRFMMWYGDVVISASSNDQQAHPSRRCDCGLALSFRSTETNQFVIRLALSLLPADHKSSLGEGGELTMTPTESSSGKGKGKASSDKLVPTTYQLPDAQVLPTRLSSISISLYTLRHLASIALSTQPAKDASASYHSLRCLANSIQMLGRAHIDADSKGGKTLKKEDEDLLSRMRERLKRLRKSGSAGSGAVTPTAASMPLSISAPIPIVPTRTSQTAVEVSNDSEGVFGIGSNPSGGTYAVPLPRSSMDLDGRSAATKKLTSRTQSAERTHPFSRPNRLVADSSHTDSGTTSKAGELGPSLGFGTTIRPKRLDSNGEVSDLSEEETRWLPTLTRV